MATVLVLSPGPPWYQTLSSEKNGFYTRYKKAQIELRELRTAQQNVEAFFRKEECGHAVPQQEVK